MRRAAAIIGVITAAAALLTAGYVARPLSSEPTSKTAPPPGTLATSIQVPQTWAAARAWADPPTREERAPIVVAAMAQAENLSPEPAATGTLAKVSEPSAPVRPRALHRSLPRPMLRPAQINRPDKRSRRAVVQAIRHQRRHEPGPTSPEVAAVDEPAPTRVEAEPIEFSLASR